jgi:hypothetical protein
MRAANHLVRRQFALITPGQRLCWRRGASISRYHSGKLHAAKGKCGTSCCFSCVCDGRAESEFRSGLLSRMHMYTCACNDPSASFITTGIRLFTPASFIYMPTAKLPHKPFAKSRAQNRREKNAEWKKLVGKNWQANSIFACCVYRGLIIGLAPEE